MFALRRCGGVVAVSSRWRGNITHVDMRANPTRSILYSRHRSLGTTSKPDSSSHTTPVSSSNTNSDSDSSKKTLKTGGLFVIGLYMGATIFGVDRSATRKEDDSSDSTTSGSSSSFNPSHSPYLSELRGMVKSSAAQHEPRDGR